MYVVNSQKHRMYNCYRLTHINIVCTIVIVLLTKTSELQLLYVTSDAVNISPSVAI